MSSQVVIRRESWIDSAKGLSIALVVLTHAIGSMKGDISMPAYVLDVNQLFLPIRMPLFFLVAGFFAHKALYSGWREFTDRKLLHFAYFYILWNSIAIISRVVLSEFSNHEADLHDLWRFLWRPYFSLWFLYGLFLSFLVARLTRSIPILVQLSCCLLIVIFLTISKLELPYIFSSFFRLYPFFLVGCYFSASIRNWITQRSSLLSFALLLLFFAGGYLALELFNIFHFSVYYPLAVIGCFGVLILLYRTQNSAFTRLLRYLGSKSLAIYLIHFLTVAISREVIIRFGFAHSPVVLLILANAMISIVLCIIFEAVFIRSRVLSFLMVRPSIFRVKERPAAQRSSSGDLISR